MRDGNDGLLDRAFRRGVIAQITICLDQIAPNLSVERIETDSFQQVLQRFLPPSHVTLGPSAPAKAFRTIRRGMSRDRKLRQGALVVVQAIGEVNALGQMRLAQIGRDLQRFFHANARGRPARPTYLLSSRRT